MFSGPLGPKLGGNGGRGPINGILELLALSLQFGGIIELGGIIVLGGLLGLIICGLPNGG